MSDVNAELLERVQDTVSDWAAAIPLAIQSSLRERGDLRTLRDAILALPGLQAEATTEAEVAAIEKRHADCEAFYSNHGPFRPTWHKDRATLLAKLRATSQAEAQASTTVAQASVAPEACVPGMWHCPKCKLILTAKFIDQATCTVGMNDEPQRCLNECGPMWRYTWKAYAEDMEARAVEQLDRAKKAEAALASTVGAPAPEPTHARDCGYWLDLNCSCGLEGDTP